MARAQPSPSQALIKGCLLVWSSGRSWYSWIEAYNTRGVVIQRLISGCSTMGSKWDWEEQGIRAQSVLQCHFGTLTGGFSRIALLCWNANMGAMKKCVGGKQMQVIWSLRCPKKERKWILTYWRFGANFGQKKSKIKSEAWLLTAASVRTLLLFRT